MLRPILTPVCALALSCSSTAVDAPNTRTPPAGATDAADANADKDATDEALARVPKVLESVAALRSLDVRQAIGASRQTPKQFRAFVTEQLERELPRDKAATLSTALFRFGLLEKQIDLRKTLEDALVSQVGAYYDPKRAAFFVVMAAPNPMFADALNAHELMHGLQDQHFDLKTLMPEDDDILNSDESTARRFLIEGDATLMMTAYIPHAMSQVNILTNEHAAAMLGKQVAQMEALTIDQMISANEQGTAAMELGGDFAKAAESFKELPRYITAPLGMPYLRGMTMVYRVYNNGGWEAVNKLYASPPTSTEQVLHPVEKLLDQRDEPVRVTLPAKLAGLETWNEVDGDVMGELMWDTYFSTWGVADPKQSEGWGGDRYALLHDGDRHVSVVASVWDTTKDAKEFEAGYIASLEKRFDGAIPSKRGGVTQLTRPDGTTITVRRRKDAVSIVDGADAKTGKQVAAALLDAKRG